MLESLFPLQLYYLDDIEQVPQVGGLHDCVASVKFLLRAISTTSKHERLMFLGKEGIWAESRSQSVVERLPQLLADSWFGLFCIKLYESSDIDYKYREIWGDIL